MDIDAARRAEFAKYQVAYEVEGYRPRRKRLDMQASILAETPGRGGFLDIGTGHGDMLTEAERLGFSHVRGTEILPAFLNDRVFYAEAHDLPFAKDTFDAVTAFEVIEHLLPGDDEALCREMGRVARQRVIIGANNGPSFAPDGSDLHPNRRPFDEWDCLFRGWFDGWNVEMLAERPLRDTRVWRMSR